MQLNNIELVSELPGLDCAIEIGISLRSTTQFPLPLRLDRQVLGNWQPEISGFTSKVVW